MVSFTPRQWRSAPASMIHAAPAPAPASAIMIFTASGGGAPMVAPTTAAANPPTTSAPSPPMTISPACAGNATHSAVRISGAARCNVFCQAKLLPKPPL